MKCRANSSHFNSHEKRRINAPKRKSAGYWFYIVLFAFIFPLIFISIGLGVLFYFIGGWLAFLAIFTSPFIAFCIAKNTHKKMLTMSNEDYEKRFNVKNNFNDEYFHNQTMRRNNPYDPISPLYWTIGPGSSDYYNR